MRFLIALPTLIAAEVIVHSRLRPIARRFVQRRIVLPQDLPRFHRAVESAIRLRNSVPLELGLLAIVYSFGLWFWHNRFSIDVATWYAKPGGRWHLTPAGIWYVFLSIPLLQFILLRWYLRFFIWYRFLWQMSRMQCSGAESDHQESQREYDSSKGQHAGRHTGVNRHGCRHCHG